MEQTENNLISIKKFDYKIKEVKDLRNQAINQWMKNFKYNEKADYINLNDNKSHGNFK